MPRRNGRGRTRATPAPTGTITAAALRTAITTHEAGATGVRYEGLHITGALDLSGCRLDLPLVLTDCVFDEPLGLTRLVGVDVDLSRSTLPALHADRLALDGELRLSGARLGDGDDTPRPLLEPAGGEVRRSPRRLREGTVIGTVRLADARIGGNLVLEELTVADTAAWSLLAPRLTIGGSVQARRLRTTGALYLRDARVTYAVNLHAADVGGIIATSLVCGGGWYADWGFRSGGRIHLNVAEVGGVVTFHDSVLSGPDASLLLNRLRTPRLRVDLREAPGGDVVLQDATVDVLVDSPETWPAPGRLHLEGLTYKRLETAHPVEVAARTGWLTRDTHAGRGTFEQLAKSYDATGDQRAARAVRHAGERRLRRQDSLSGRAWGALQDVLFGYGYAPGRALVWLLCLVAAGSLWFAHHHPRPVAGAAGRAWDPVLYSLDLLVPVASLGYRGGWDPVGVGKAVALFLTVSGWVLATAVIAGARRVLGRN